MKWAIDNLLNNGDTLYLIHIKSQLGGETRNLDWSTTNSQKFLEMILSALLTSAGINIGVCVVLFSLYSILRKQPNLVGVYFGRKLASARLRHNESFCFERLVPSVSWVVKAWETTDEEILVRCGMDAIVFLRMIVLSTRVFCIASAFCIFLVTPVNYYGKKRQYHQIHLESLQVFTILNVSEGSKWLWAHCLVLYIITSSACILLYFEYKRITKMRLNHITDSSTNPSNFTVIVRSIPWSPQESYNDSVLKYFSKYHESTYLSHQMVYRTGTMQKLLSDAGKICKILKPASAEQNVRPTLMKCCLCGEQPNSFRMLTSEPESVNGKADFTPYLAKIKDCAAAFVFFKTRYSAVVAAQVLQSSNPMLWVTDLAPEPHDIYWSNLWIPYKLLWIRKIGILVASIAFMIAFLFPVAFVQGLSQLDKLKQRLPFLKGILKKKFMVQMLTGYMPSVILILFLYTVPPTMMLFSAVEGSISRSGRKKSACIKVLYFTIWNVFFANVFTGSVVSRLHVFTSVNDLPTTFANAVPSQASFFLTFVLSSGWASLACELMQPLALICKLLKQFVFGMKDDSPESVWSFPFHTEIPRVLVFGFLGFICSILVPLITPFLLFYFVLAYLVYRNQILNVYVSKYESRGQYWPIIHTTFIFSMVTMQVLALATFGIKRSKISAGFTIPLIICTLLFNVYCRQRFHPVFKSHVAQVLIEMDQRDQQSGRLEEIYQELHSAYCQYKLASHELSRSGRFNHHKDDESYRNPPHGRPGMEHDHVDDSWGAGCNFEIQEITKS